MPKLRIDAGRLENALVPLEELYFLQKDFPGVFEQIGSILQTLALEPPKRKTILKPIIISNASRLSTLRTRRLRISRTGWNSEHRRCSRRPKRPIKLAICRRPWPPRNCRGDVA